MRDRPLNRLIQDWFHNQPTFGRNRFAARDLPDQSLSSYLRLLTFVRRKQVRVRESNPRLSLHKAEG